MAARTELEIVWDGPIKGLAENRVSLAKFANALAHLVTAAQRIASQKIKNAIEPAARGRLINAAKNLDIELRETVKGSGGFSSYITFDVPDDIQGVLFDQLPEIVGIELLESIDSEARGIHRNQSVRNYLACLPAELNTQKYNLHDNGRTIKHIEVAKMDLPRLSDPLPSFSRVSGKISGVGFEPGKLEVKVKGEEVQMVANATEAQVNDAISLRSQDVRALAITSQSGTRLLLLETEDRKVVPPTINEIFDKWDALFRALA